MKKNYVFEVVTTCQGNPFRKQYNTLFTALLGYAKEYLTKNKYGTMNFKLQQRFFMNNKKLNLFDKDKTKM